MRTVSFGLGLQYSTLATPAIALNSEGVLLEISVDGIDLRYRYGRLDSASVIWADAEQYDTGKTPMVAMSKSVNLEVHESDKNPGELWYNGGVWTSSGVDWKTNAKYDGGISPSIAVNDAGIVVEVHQHPTEEQIYYRSGTVSGTKINWASDKGVKLFNGTRPRVALNNHNIVVVSYYDGERVILRAGTASGSSIALTGSPSAFEGASPSIALTDDNIAVLVWEVPNATFGSVLNQATLAYSDIAGVTDITVASQSFDTGRNLSVAANGSRAVQVHETDTGSPLYFSTSLIVSREKWMQDSLSRLGDRRLPQLCLPASHDAGMYTGTFSSPARTQDLNIFSQAFEAGVRWYDFRPIWTPTGAIYIYHTIPGPSLAEVLSDLKSFLQLGHQELLLLKFSHFALFDAAVYKQMVQQITDSIGPWLYKKLPDQKNRLSEVTLSEFVADGPRVLVLVDGDWAIDQPADGFWVYRNWGSDAAAKGDLCVYDKYYGRFKLDYDGMKENQFEKFNEFTGICKDGVTPCDLFLLSWTLTPLTLVWVYAQEPDRRLGNDIRELAVPNQYGKIVNMLYVDYVEYARPADVALYLMGVAP
jgi:hypothetical protein